jgi:hypothetical protein
MFVPKTDTVVAVFFLNFRMSDEFVRMRQLERMAPNLFVA